MCIRDSRSDLGWAIGRGEVYEDLNYQDEVESNAIYDLLEKDIVPLFYNHGVDGLPRVWHLVENLTSFERSARQRAPDMAVVWLPGFPPGWWQESMRHLLAGAPAPAEIACDPDPAGIAIALQAARLWEAASLPWMPFAMRRDDLLAASQRKPLTGYDRQQLAQLLAGKLPPVLRQLAATLLELGEKAEQEAYL